MASKPTCICILCLVLLAQKLRRSDESFCKCLSKVQGFVLTCSFPIADEGFHSRGWLLRPHPLAVFPRTRSAFEKGPPLIPSGKLFQRKKHPSRKVPGLHVTSPNVAFGEAEDNLGSCPGAGHHPLHIVPTIDLAFHIVPGREPGQTVLAHIVQNSLS